MASNTRATNNRSNSARNPVAGNPPVTVTALSRANMSRNP